MGYQVLFKITESRHSEARGPVDFPTSEAREEFVNGPDVFWYHDVEEDDWMLWRRGGAWNATQEPGPADRINTPPEITEADRW